MEFMLGGVGLVVVVVEEDVVVIVVVLCALGIEFTDPLSLKRERERVSDVLFTGSSLIDKDRGDVTCDMGELNHRFREELRNIT